ncbi:MAG: alpha/beta hydrolase fold domain-containing protein [Planctomycetota bacterium]
MVCRFVFVFAISTVAISFEAAATAEETQPDGDSKRRATALLKKLDKDGNGTFERSENEALWRRYRKLDANRDEALTVTELRRWKPTYLSTSGEQKRDLVYKQTNEGDLLLDLYYPAKEPKQEPDALPLVVYTHGGGWSAGDKHNITRGSFPPVFTQLLGHGFAVASVSYRLCQQGNEIAMRDCVTDCKDACRYLALQQDSLRLDSNRFFVMGDSAGGHIAQMLLLTPDDSFVGDPRLAAAQYRIQAGVSWYGPCDFENVHLFNHDDREGFRDRFEARIMGSAAGEDAKRTRYHEISPVNYLSEGSPPLLMLQGDNDTTIPVKHALHMASRASSIDAPVEIMIIQNAGHNWRRVNEDIEPSREAIIQRTVQFLVETLH